MVVAMKSTAFWDITLGEMGIQSNLKHYVTEDSTVFTAATGTQNHALFDASKTALHNKHYQQLIHKPCTLNNNKLNTLNRQANKRTICTVLFHELDCV